MKSQRTFGVLAAVVCLLGAGAIMLSSRGRGRLRNGHPDPYSTSHVDGVPATSAAIEENEQHARRAMATLLRAESAFRSKDVDGNSFSDFWIADVAGLYWLQGVDGNPIKLVDVDIAGADLTPVTAPGIVSHPVIAPRPYHGYFFRMMPGYDRGNGRNPSQYAFLAVPSEYGKTGRRTFIGNEDYTVYGKDTGGKAPDRFPADPVAEGW